jgi:NitT/TauT family transport system substrate-binding protein
MTRVLGVIAAIAVVSASATAACAADKLKLAVGQCGNWDSSPVELGVRIGAYAKHGVEVEALCTQGTGETQQAVIAGSADLSASARWVRSAPLPKALRFASCPAAPPAMRISGS